MYEFRNAKFNKVGSIDCEINHPQYGWIWTTVAPYDVNESMREFYDVVASAGSIAPYIPPTAEEARAQMPDLSRKQFRLGMRDLGVTTSMIQAALDTISDEDEREIAQIEWEDSSSYSRNHPLIAQLALTFGKSDEQIDQAWQTAQTYT